MKKALFLIIVYSLFSCSSNEPQPDVNLVKQRSNDIITGMSNCDAITALLNNEISSNLYIHGWEAIGAVNNGYVLFYAGFEEIPKSEYLVLAWKIKDDTITYLYDPKEAIEFVRNMMKDSSDGIPAASMIQYQNDWNMCSFNNIDFYNGETLNFKAIIKFPKNIKLWKVALNLPFRSLHQHYSKLMQEKNNH